VNTISRTRRQCYRCASIIGDVQAIASGNPSKIAKRFCRKCAYRSTGKLLQQLFR
jgi:hypothetical protein